MEPWVEDGAGLTTLSLLLEADCRLRRGLRRGLLTGLLVEAGRGLLVEVGRGLLLEALRGLLLEAGRRFEVVRGLRLELPLRLGAELLGSPLKRFAGASSSELSAAESCVEEAAGLTALALLLEARLRRRPGLRLGLLLEVGFGLLSEPSFGPLRALGMADVGRTCTMHQQRQHGSR